MSRRRGSRGRVKTLEWASLTPPLWRGRFCDRAVLHRCKSVCRTRLRMLQPSLYRVFLGSSSSYQRQAVNSYRELHTSLIVSHARTRRITQRHNRRSDMPSEPSHPRNAHRDLELRSARFLRECEVCLRISAFGSGIAYKETHLRTFEARRAGDVQFLFLAVCA